MIFTDGACSGNPGPGGWAFILRHLASGKELENSGAELLTTNNKMELTAVVRGLDPDMKGLLGLGSRGVIVTARDESGQFDFISRFFGPGVGIDEDPVTGSAHCTLGPYWSTRLGKTTLNAWQASPRGGGMQVTVEGDRIKLLGDAITVLRGELCC